MNEIINSVRMDKTALRVASLSDESDDRSYWSGTSPEVRWAVMEYLRVVNYGYDSTTERLQRVFTVVDLGCSYAAQAFLFERHHAYIGVARSDCQRFAAENSTHHQMTIADFLEQHGSRLSKKTTFAICSYVPPWHGDNMQMVREFFVNVFTFYPHGGLQVVLPLAQNPGQVR